MVMGHGICKAGHSKVTCVSDVSRGRGPSSASTVNKKASDSLPASSLSHSTLYNTPHLQTKDSISLHKHNFQNNPIITMDAVK